MSVESSIAEQKNYSPEINRLLSMFKEETWTKTDPKEVGPGAFQDLRAIIQGIKSPDDLTLATERVAEQLMEHPDSLYGQFLNGLLALRTGNHEGQNLIKKLIDLYRNLGKWANVEYLANLVLEFKENVYALRALAIALDKLNRSKDAMLTWENVARLDKDDPEVAKNVGEYYIIENNPAKGLFFIRQSFEANIRKREVMKLDALWKTILELAPEDWSYFEKIEKMLLDNREKEKIGQLFIEVLKIYKEKGDEEVCIDIMKKILAYNPSNNYIRKELTSVYEQKYASHSRLNEIMEVSKLKNYKKPATTAIEEFEQQIALDTGRYVFHRSWGVGKIMSMDESAIFIDFQDKKNHRMTIEMALPSLQPLSPDHIWVTKAENFEIIKKFFDEDVIAFFEILLNSYNKRINLADIKMEVCPDFLPSKDWSKWWTKTRNLLKKEPIFGISDKKRDEFFLRDKPISFSEKILNQFNRTKSFDKKVDIALDFVSNYSAQDIKEACLPHLIDYFSEPAREQAISSWMITALFMLHDLQTLDENSENALALSHIDRIAEMILDATNLATVARGMGNQELKKRFLQMIQERRDDWPKIFTEVLFETPIKIHKYIISELIKKEQFEAINQFIEQAIAGYKEIPEIFLWTTKNISQNLWPVSSLNYSFQDLLLYLLRLMLQLPRIETKGTKQKNLAVDIIKNDDYKIIREALHHESDYFIIKTMDLTRGLSILEETDRERIHEIAREMRPELGHYFENQDREEAKPVEMLEYDDDIIFTTQLSFDKKSQDYDDLVQNQIPAIAQEIGRAAEYGDLRENAEYKAALEKQGTLKATISKLQEDINRARVQTTSDIDSSRIGFGIRIRVMNLVSNEEEFITILGPWDADHTKNIISYKAPLGRAFLGRQVDDEVVFHSASAERRYKILELINAL